MDINRVLFNLALECRSRSGLVPMDSTGGDGSTFGLIWLVCLEKLSPFLEEALESPESARTFTDRFVDMFMTVLHNVVVRQRRFNWND